MTNDTVLWVTGNVGLSGQAQITIATNSSLNLYVGTTTGAGVSASLGVLVACRANPSLSRIDNPLPTTDNWRLV